MKKLLYAFLTLSLSCPLSIFCGGSGEEKNSNPSTQNLPKPNPPYIKRVGIEQVGANYKTNIFELSANQTISSDSEGIFTFIEKESVKLKAYNEGYRTGNFWGFLGGGSVGLLAGILIGSFYLSRAPGNKNN
jgi:hypothetical protein